MPTQSMHRTASAIVSITSAALLLLAAGLPARAAEPSGRPEQTLFESANRDRAALGLPQLRWDDNLAEAAQRHAAMMAAQGTLSHQYAGEPDLAARVRHTGIRFTAVAENIAEGTNVALLHEGWMHSPHHRENLLDPEMNAMGVAVTQRDGEFFAVEDFSGSVDNVPLAEQENQIGTQLQVRGLQVLRDVSDASDARQVCEGRQGRVLGSGRMFYVRYATQDLKTLPASLVHELQDGHYGVAAVGACAPSAGGGFSGYQIAVLLYER